MSRHPFHLNTGILFGLSVHQLICCRFFQLTVIINGPRLVLWGYWLRLLLSLDNKRQLFFFCLIVYWYLICSISWLRQASPFVTNFVHRGQKQKHAASTDPCLVNFSYVAINSASILPSRILDLSFLSVKKHDPVTGSQSGGGSERSKVKVFTFQTITFLKFGRLVCDHWISSTFILYLSCLSADAPKSSFWRPCPASFWWNFVAPVSACFRFLFLLLLLLFEWN